MRGTTAAVAGAAAGLVNTFHQLGMAVGLGILTAAAHGIVGDADVAAALTAATILLLATFVVSAAVIAPSGRRERRRPAEVAAAASASRG